MNTATAKGKKKQRLKPVPARVAAVKPPPVDRLANWIGRRSRFVRALMCLGIAAIITIDLALLLYGALLHADPNKLNSGPLNVENLAYVLLFFVVVAGFALYWLGWRTLIGFDLDDVPLQPGRPAALWVLFGLIAAVCTLVFGGLTFLYAIQT